MSSTMTGNASFATTLRLARRKRRKGKGWIQPEVNQTDPALETPAGTKLPTLPGFI